MRPQTAAYLKSALALGLVAILGTSVLTGVYRLTADRIAHQEQRVVLEQLGQILAPDRYDNALQDDWFRFSDEAHFPQGQQVVAYRARQSGRPVAVILRFDAIDGYNGRISLLLGIGTDGAVTGVRVTSHKETPGLGDAIEIEKSPWVLAFDGTSLRSPPPTGWRVRRDGGVFDQFTGATITPRALVKAVRLALEYHELNRQRLYEAASQTTDQAIP